MCSFACALALLFAAPAQAQTPGFAVEISASGTSADATAEACATFTATIHNASPLPAGTAHDIDLTLEDVGTWSENPSPPGSVSLEPGDQEDVEFGLCAPTGAEAGESVMVTLVAVVRSDPAEEKAQDTETFTATFRADDAAGPGGPDDNGTVDDNQTGDGPSGPESNGSPGPGAALLVGALLLLGAFGRRGRSRGPLSS